MLIIVNMGSAIGSGRAFGLISQVGHPDLFVKKIVAKSLETNIGKQHNAYHPVRKMNGATTL